MSLGTPENLDDMEAYLLDIRHGRSVSPEFVRELRTRYEKAGGPSPLLSITNRQAAALQQSLDPNLFRVYVGMRHWRPYIDSVVKKMIDDGVETIVSFPLTPYYSALSTKAYHEKVQEALASSNVNLVRIDAWNTHPLFLITYETLIREKLKSFSENVQVLFTAHSLPESVLKTNDPYPGQFLETAEALAQKLNLPYWSCAYQSQGGSREPWLGPTVEQKLEEFVREGKKEVLVVPIGFICDHMEILYDIDILFKGIAKEQNIRLERTALPNDHPQFISALKSVLLSTLETATVSK